ncbi:hypothetical protein DIPPA_70152 [Diplonema papillatum]|nr:hypothetical protein DIPPA_70152 [Diplonema papillatum]
MNRLLGNAMTWRTGQTARSVAPGVVEACSKRSQYFQTVDNLMYLHSPDGLVQRANFCHELTDQIGTQIRQCSNPIDGLDALDTVNNTMCLVLDPAEATRNTHPDPVFRDMATEAFNHVYRYMSELNASRELYAILEELVKPDVWKTLSPVQQVNVRLMKTDMDAGGIHLPKEKRDIVVHLSSLKEELGHHLVTARDEQQQQEILMKLLDTRHRLAEILGYDSYAEWTMQSTMAQNPANAWRFLNTMSSLLQPKAQEELNLLLLLKRQLLPQGDGSKVYLNEQAQLAHVYKERRFGEQAAKLREYLSVANIWRGLQLICSDVFGLRLVKGEMASYEQYHPNVQKYTVFDGDTLLGTIYADMIDRPDKTRSAGHFTVQLGTTLHQQILEGAGVDIPAEGKQLPIVIISCNARTASVTTDNWEQVNFAPEEVVTLFHEFGHALHTVLGQTEYQNLAGTRSSLDYVETFSQLFEYYARDYRVLARFAVHPTTKQPVPENLVAALNESDQVFSATHSLEQLIASALDLASHGTRPLTYVEPTTGSVVQCNDPSALFSKLSELHLPLACIPDTTVFCHSVQHTSNYPAAYYSYAYSKVIAAAIWKDYFADNPFSENGGRKLRKVMAKGASEGQHEMLSIMFGEKTDPAEFLQRNGLAFI